MKKWIPKILLLVLFAALIASYFLFDLGQYLNLEYIKANQDVFYEYYQKYQYETIAIYFVIYVITTALSLPGAAILTLLGGGLFGLTTGMIVVSFASTLGATIAFFSSRFILRESIQKKFNKQFKKINKGIEKEGAFYLFSLRLIPIFPFFVINLVMGLTNISTLTYWVVSQIGMLPGTFVYVNAGLQLSQIDSLSGIVSFELLGSFALLGIFPLIASKMVRFVKKRKVYKNYKKPKSFDYNMIVIGAGSAGLVTSYICATVKAKVLLVEKNKMGGDCLNTGCVPSKAIIKSAKVSHHIKTADDYGINVEQPKIDFPKVMQRVHRVIKDIEPHDSVERYTNLGVECKLNEAKIISPWEVEIDGQSYTTKNITIATGARPRVPKIEGIENINILTSENLWQLQSLPNKLVVMGGGPIGCEMAQAFSRLGSEVTLIERSDKLLSMEDPEVSDFIKNKFEQDGIKLLFEHEVMSFNSDDKSKSMTVKHADIEKNIEFDEVLVSIGREPNTKGFGLEDLNIRLREDGTIETNEYLETNYPNIYACGDVTGPYQLTHTASHQAWYCAVNALFGTFKRFKVDYSVIPWATYIDPEVATVGLNEKMAKQKEIEYDLTTYNIDDLDRAIADNQAQGFVRVLTRKGKDEILGATIVGQHGSELIIEFISAMKNNFGLNKILGTIHPYPTMSEANKFAAGNWKKKQTPEKLMKLVKNFHRFTRS